MCDGELWRRKNVCAAAVICIPVFRSRKYALQYYDRHSGSAQDPSLVIEWAKQLCDVLGYLHTRRPPIIYRDLNPVNIFLTSDGTLKLLDFTCAREYRESRDDDTTFLGTRGYAAPEQFGGRGRTDPRTDIYNLGATLYHLITGYSPADTDFVIYPIGKFIPQLKGSGIEALILKCCQPDPADRFQNSAELMYALNHVFDRGILGSVPWWKRWMCSFLRKSNDPRRNRT